MRKHEVNCQIEGEKEYGLGMIQEKINIAFMKSVANILKKSNLSKEEQIYMLEQIQANLKNYNAVT